MEDGQIYADRIPETNPFGWLINILSIKVAVWLVIRDGLVIIGMNDCEVRELKGSMCFRCYHSSKYLD